jgi:hypothetical protein
MRPAAAGPVEGFVSKKGRSRRPPLVFGCAKAAASCPSNYRP